MLLSFVFVEGTHLLVSDGKRCVHADVQMKLTKTVSRNVETEDAILGF